MDQLGADKAFVVAYPDQDLLVSKCFKTSSKLKTAKDLQNGDNEEKEWRHRHQPSYVLLLIPFIFCPQESCDKIDFQQDNNPREKNFHFGIINVGDRKCERRWLWEVWSLPIGCDTQLLPVGLLHLPILFIFNIHQT